MRKFQHFACAQLWVALIFLLTANARAAEICLDGECSPAISQTKYYGWDAWRLSDGKTDAVIVPAIGRVMSFGRAGGDNWLWSALLQGGKTPDFGGWKNWGGDKTWLSPQAEWGKFGSKNGWPPAQEWDQLPFDSEVVSGGHLKITGRTSAATGARVIREFWHEEDGTFVVKQTVEKLRGAPISFGIWSITQVDNSKISAAYLPRNADSDYENGFVRLNNTLPDRVAPQAVASSMLQVLPTSKGSYKIGVDAPLSAIAVTSGDWAFIQTAARPDGDYPDGQAGKSGTPVQLFGTGDSKMNYLELELLSPLKKFVAGARWTHTIKWRLEKLPSADVNDAAVHAAIEKAFAK